MAKRYVSIKAAHLSHVDVLRSVVSAFFRGTKYIELPYAVKGMDVSFSGILSYIEVSRNMTVYLYQNTGDKVHLEMLFIFM